MENKKTTHGGARAGSGRKKGEEQVTIGFKATKSFVAMLDKKRGTMSRNAFIKQLIVNSEQ